MMMIIVFLFSLSPARNPCSDEMDYGFCELGSWKLVLRMMG